MLFRDALIELSQKIKGRISRPGLFDFLNYLPQLKNILSTLKNQGSNNSINYNY